ncbi:unnamed protein product [Durusdinium trenchii]|uniref:Uncharacterized protein n=1 Tax=Durusdinium trenchii TaxID=1381693 RepID=A0ABP0KWI0_9DINO
MSVTSQRDTAAGRHLFGRQALTQKMRECASPSNSPVNFTTGGGAQQSADSLAFTGSKILEGEEVYILKECPPAQSICCCGIPCTYPHRTPTLAASVRATPFSWAWAYPFPSTRGSAFVPWFSTPIRPLFRLFLPKLWPACFGLCMVLPCLCTALTTSSLLGFNTSKTSSSLPPRRMLPSFPGFTLLVVPSAAEPSGNAS